MTSLKAPFFEDNKRAPLDLVAVIDKSGSMRRDMELVRRTLSFILTQLTSKDRFCIISFEDDVWIELPLSTMDQIGKETATKQIASIEDMGSTNLSGGLLKGLRVLRERPLDARNEVASLLLLTDGHANRGLVGIEEIKRAMLDPTYNPPANFASGRSGRRNRKQCRNRRAPLSSSPPKEETPAEEMPLVDTNTEKLPCSVYTFGFGSNHNSTLLEQIADMGDGVYFFIENKDAIADSFADCLGGLMSVVGQNLSLSFKGLNGAVIKKVFYKNTSEEKEHKVLLGDIQSEERRDILVSLTVPALDAPQEDCNILEATLSGFNVLTGQTQVISTTASVIRGEAEEEGLNEEVAKGKLRIETVDAIELATEFAESGKLEEAKQHLSTHKEMLGKWGNLGGNDVDGFLEDVDECAEIVQSRNVFSQRKHRMKNIKMEHCKQRNARACSKGKYNNRKKGAMKARNLQWQSEH